ncbi:MAG: polyphosphate kinase 1 [Chitinophagales bacterium]|nr:polyphosphate kinase 1 [Chitinophagales bacterium]
MPRKEEGKIINREISWLSFNERVLQEAADPSVPLLERLKFMGIFSNNLDEFFRVRFASVKRVVKYKVGGEFLQGGSPKQILNQIKAISLRQRTQFQKIYEQILYDLEKEGIYILNESNLDKDQALYVQQYFLEVVQPNLTPLLIDVMPEFPTLNDHHIYLAVKCSTKKNKNGSGKKTRYALIDVPTDVCPRFVVLPSPDDKHYIILLDDIIRYNLREIFYLFEFDNYEAYTIKLSRDAELNIDNDVTTSFIEKLSKSIRKREVATPVRFVYDEQIPKDLLNFLTSKLNITEHDSIIPGARYHNFRDFIHFPDLGLQHLKEKKMAPLPHPALKPYTSIFTAIKKGDILLHFPYQSFHHITHLLREAAIDPKVKEISMSLYRVSRDSAVINALLNALRNGKKVNVIVELQARFDEERNIYYAKKLADEGANIIYGVRGLKVHAKLCLITRKEKGQMVYYASIGTGNFNEDTARLYCDESLFTCDTRITGEVARVFGFLENHLKVGTYRHLLVSPFTMRRKLVTLINQEMKNAQAGKPAEIILKLNGLVDENMALKLYDASKAGVKVRLIIRGICALIPGMKGISENIEAISIIDKYLEHSRVYAFANGGDWKYYISSADWMTRNLDYRVEVACPIYDANLKKEIRDMLEIQFSDNTKARIINGERQNKYKRDKSQVKIRAQEELYNYLKALNPKEA